MAGQSLILFCQLQMFTQLLFIDYFWANFKNELLNIPLSHNEYCRLCELSSSVQSFILVNILRFNE